MAAKRKTTKAKRATAPKAKSTRASSSSRLLRSRNDRMIGGVLGGVGEYLKIDSTILRLGWIAVVAFTGFVPGIVAYALAMLVIPER